MNGEPRRLAWLVDDDASLRLVLGDSLRDAGLRVQVFQDVAEVVAALDEGVPDLLVTDVRMPDGDGIELLARVRAAHPELPVIVMSAFTDVPTTAGAFRHGAFDYLAKPFDLDDMMAVVRRALGDIEPPARTAVAHTPGLVGDSPAMLEVFRAVGRLAQLNLPVLVTGETGTGKELVARALHSHSPRAAQPFVALNTAALPAELLESELFGHEAGSFTGAARRHIGRFEEAADGTLFLDEIGDMPLAMQTRLLRVLAEGEFYRVGGRELIRTQARVIAATHQDLDAKVAAGTFRADLLHRLDVVRIHLPPLRDRREDIPRLAEYLLARAARELSMLGKRLTPDAVARMQRYGWPGNVRQLENLCRRITALLPGRDVHAADLDELLRSDAAVAPQRGGAAQDWTDGLRDWLRNRWRDSEPGTLHAVALEAFEQALFDAALDLTEGNRVRAAEHLGLSRNTLTRKLGRKRSP
ncbi:nitrogen regulation protein NR(I) [Pseudofulvimonas gallinarii]|uniref:DNA-binding transcriptional regulator NtrC n=1 Tax=Pseudofulvimonas gallinarii TaxID=634155 RepID=A0A4S3KTK6_9GAMM|nr:nitrogen regulation protein NR(I) [Pseudofulvimonas gallinarii]TCT00405.1 two-component system nitrogen regulation response regulator GlnG [Pseudofulvimonas gallinarii]THD12366.1 nitrogen regulation protein NR(I) [Pseudofulvimonas gallinarii]